jgi:hypothetical protein
LAGKLEVLKVGQDLHNLPEILRVQLLHEGLAYNVGEELIQCLGRIRQELGSGFRWVWPLVPF